MIMSINHYEKSIIITKNFECIWGFFFREGFWATFCNMVNIFTCRRPNRSGVGAMDSPDLFEQVLDQRYIPEVSEKLFTHDISMIRRQKMVIFGVLKVFIKNFTSNCAEEVCPPFSHTTPRIFS